MRYVIVSALTLALALSTAAWEFGPQAPVKTDPVITPNVPQTRQGGDTIADAVVIPDLPYGTTGTTTGYTHDYDETCPYSGSLSPDVVYAWTPANNIQIDIDLCGSSYDTKVYVYDDDAQNLVACNDDYYFDDVCGVYVSKIEFLDLSAGVTYYIVVDGYGGDHGDYILQIFESPFCVLECPPGGVAEGEPPLQNDSLPDFNCGCGCVGPDLLFSELVGDQNGEAVFCGTSGWFLFEGSDHRETDWLTAVVGPAGTVEVEIDGEFAIYLFHLLPTDCSNVAVEQSVLGGPCVPVTMTVAGDPGEVLWLWTGPTTFESPTGLTPLEFDYILRVSGLEGVVATETSSWGAVKSLYR